MTNNESLDFSRLMAESSLGSRGAQELISRTEPAEVSRVLETARAIESLTGSTQDARRNDRSELEVEPAGVKPAGEGAWVLLTARVTPRRDFFALLDNEVDFHIVHDSQIQRPNRTPDANALRARLNRDGASHWLTRVGFVGITACDAAGITRRTLDYWDRTGLVKPSLRSTTADSDDLQWYSFRDVLTLKVIKRLLGAGISLQQIRAAVQHLQERSTDDLTRVTLMSDGVSVYECTSNDEVIDLLQSGQGVFGIALGGVWREVETKLSELTGNTSQPAAELTEDVSDESLRDESLREDMSTSCGSRDGS